MKLSSAKGLGQELGLRLRLRRRRRHGLGIRLRLVLLLMLSVTSVLVLAGFIDQRRAVAALEDDRSRAVAATCDRLTRLLPQAINDLDTRAIANVLESELHQSLLSDLVVHLGDRTLGRVADPDQPPPGAAIRIHRKLPATVDGEVPEVILVVDERPLEAARNAVFWQTAGRIAGVDLSIILIVSMVVSRITRPIRLLTYAAEGMAAGRLDEAVDITAQDEVGVLARTFDRMRSSIRQTILTIEEQNRVLDERVQERSRRLEQVQQELLEAANAAGKAEIATGALHNIGNVLTGVAIGLDALRRGPDPYVAESARRLVVRLQGGLPGEGGDDLARLVVLVLENLAAQDDSRRVGLADLERRLGLIRDVLAIQQAHAAAKPFLQVVDLHQETDDMLLLHEAALRRRGIRVVREYQASAPVLADRSRLGHVIANLIKNAKEAMDAVPEESRVLTVRIAPAPGQTVLQLTDTGAGVAAADQDRLFTHGFTTKTDGHGFGLHYCVTTVAEMHGTLELTSPGLGQGATAILALPVVIARARAVR